MIRSASLAAMLLLPLLLLAACDQPAVPAGNAAANAGAPAEHGIIKRMAALPEAERRLVFFRAITAGGGNGQCQGVDKLETMKPAPNGQPVWRVTCVEGSQWLVQLGDDGNAIVTGAAPR